MERIKRGVILAVALCIMAAALIVGRPTRIAAVPSSESVIALPNPFWTWAALAEPVEQQISHAMQNLIHAGRSTFRILVGLFGDVFSWWGGWLKGAVFSIAVAMLAALADRGLMNTWRTEGLAAVLQQSALMLYVYARLLFSGGINPGPKLLFLGALIYGVVQRDLVPDTTLVPGRVEDVVFIVIATRAFMYACPDALLNEYASSAVSFRRRIASLQRPR